MTYAYAAQRTRLSVIIGSGVPVIHALQHWLLYEQDKSVADLMNLIDTARIRTSQRVSTLEAEVEASRAQLAEAARRKSVQSGRAAADDEEEGGARADAAGRQREQEELATAPNPINEYVEMLEEEVCYPALLLFLQGRHLSM